jgi:nucleoside-diphosphate-sugar epimerase
MIILATGSAGFVGKHLMEALGRRPGVQAIGFDLGSNPAVLEEMWSFIWRVSTVLKTPMSFARATPALQRSFAPGSKLLAASP